MNSVVPWNDPEYKTCMGRGCNNVATQYLKLVFVRKAGWFCSVCAEDLKENGLVDGSNAS
jgi:hypothetical protein